MDTSFISLLYPHEESLRRHQNPANIPTIREECCEEMGLAEIFGLKNSNLSEYFTAEPEVIRYRQDALTDLLQFPALGETLSRALPILCDILELRRLDTDRAPSGESYLYSITEIELYVSCIDTLFAGLSSLRDELRSAAFRTLCDRIIELAESDYYKDLNEKLKQLSSRIHEVRSITVGVNLDAQLRPCAAGVLSINSDQFKSGHVLDKILRMSFRNDATTCIADLIPFGRGSSENRREALLSAFHSAIEEVFRSSVKQWRAIVGEYVLDNTDFLLRLLPEIEFVTRATALIRRLEEKGCVTCVPELRPMEEKTFTAEELYNPQVALAIREEVVTNSFTFDDEGRIFIITGPNRGGKSVITCAVGLAQAMCQLGLRVPAKSAAISPVDGIFIHFPTGAEDTIDKGRLGEECVRLRAIFEEVTENSMILLDESLSSTGAYEASYIAAEILAGFGLVRCRGIFTTHLHELAAQTNSINERSLAGGGVRIDNMVAGMEEGHRSFKVYRARPDGKSYARDIADKYGLSFENIQTIIHKSERGASHE